jgi:hypothetical protein
MTDCGGAADRGEKGLAVAVIAGCDAAEVLQL